VNHMQAMAVGGCAATLHLPEGGRFRQLVLICNSFGYEGLYVHRALAALGEDLAAAGMAALRLDYPDQGDSVDLPPEADAVGAWLDSLRAALAWARHRYPGVALSLCGYRLGALLAAEVAAQEPELCGLVLLSPVMSGRSYVRELKLSIGPNAAQAEVQGLSQEGWWLSAASLQRLAGLDLKHLGAPARIDVLALADSGTRALEKWAAAFRATAEEGASRPLCCEVHEAPELLLLRDDSHAVTVPETGFAQVVDWLRRRPAQPSRPAAEPDPAPLPAAWAVPGGVEQHLRYGPQKAFAAVWTRPDPDRGGGPCLLILNTGGNPRSGHNRLSVRLARALLQQGVSTLRVDVSGTGDAWPVQRGRNQALYSGAPVADVGVALDWLEHQGHGRPAVLGLCSGAYLGFQAALAQERVGSLLMVNSQSFLWHGRPFGEPVTEGAAADQPVQLKHLDRYHRIVFTADFWRRLWRREVRVWEVVSRLVGAHVFRLASAVQARLPGWLVLVPRAAAIQRHFAALLRRRLPLLLVYGDTDPGMNELQACFGPAGMRLARQSGVSVQIVPGADHTFTEPASTDTLVRIVGEFVRHRA